MSQYRARSIALGLPLLAVVMTGCAPKMTMEDLKAMMPQRPAELDKLNAFVGTWNSEAEAKMAGLDEPLRTTAQAEIKWEGDGWYLVSRETFTMGELGNSHGLGTWSYDMKHRVYRTSWVDSSGMTGMGKSWHDEKTNTWHMRGKSHGPWGTTTFKGSVTMTDPNTMTWNWTEYAMGGLMKVMEMTGTSSRQ